MKYSLKNQFGYYRLKKSYFWIAAHRRIVLKFVKSLLEAKRKLSKLKILDAGCGRGELLDLFIPWGEVTAVDVSEDAVDFCRKKYNVQSHRMLIQDMSFADNSFDFIFCIDVIEHIKNDFVAMKELYRVLKPDGFLIMTSPAFMSLWGYHDEEQGHFRRYTTSKFIQLSNQAGFKIKKCCYFKFLLFLPLYFIRRFKTIIRHRSDDFYQVNHVINKILSILLEIEATIISKVSLPIGSSLVAVLSK